VRRVSDVPTQLCARLWNDENIDLTVPVPDVEIRIAVGQLTHELQELIRCMDGMSVHVQNDVAAPQTGIGCRRSALDLRDHHSNLSRLTGDSYSPNFDCPLQNRRKRQSFHRTVNGYCLGSPVSQDFDEKRPSKSHLSQPRIEVSLAAYWVAVD